MTVRDLISAVRHPSNAVPPISVELLRDVQRLDWHEIDDEELPIATELIIRLTATAIVLTSRGVDDTKDGRLTILRNIANDILYSEASEKSDELAIYLTKLKNSLEMEAD